MSTSVLLSIKPEHAEKIFSGRKLFEFRRVLFKDPTISRVVVYASHPVQMVIGEFAIAEILVNSKSRLWTITKKHAGINKAFFDKYFGPRTKAFAIKIKMVQRYAEPMALYTVAGTNRPPQSFMYLRDETSKASVDSLAGALLIRKLSSNDAGH